jgi:hypothetical protein
LEEEVVELIPGEIMEIFLPDLVAVVVVVVQLLRSLASP